MGAQLLLDVVFALSSFNYSGLDVFRPLRRMS
jgi:hypothetical protein